MVASPFPVVATMMSVVLKKQYLGKKGAFAKVAERLLELQLLFCAQKRKAGSEEPAIHGIIRYDE